MEILHLDDSNWIELSSNISAFIDYFQWTNIFGLITQAYGPAGCVGGWMDEGGQSGFRDSNTKTDRSECKQKTVKSQNIKLIKITTRQENKFQVLAQKM